MRKWRERYPYKPTEDWPLLMGKPEWGIPK